MISTLKQMLPTIENWPVEDQEALAEAAREIEAARSGLHVTLASEEIPDERDLARRINEAFDDPSEDVSAQEVFAGLEERYDEDMRTARRGA